MAQEAVLSVEAADFAAGSLTILEDVSLAVRAREFVCIVGASGCGKTTLLRLLAGLLRPTRGRVLYRGQPIAGAQPALAVVFQDYGRALLPWRTVAGNVALALEARGVPRKARAAIVHDVLARRLHLALELPDGGAAFAPQAAELVAPTLGWSAQQCAAQVRTYHATIAAERAALEELQA